MSEGEPRHRSVRIPHLLRIVSGHAAAAAALEELTDVARRRFLLVHSGRASATGYGATLAEAARRLGLQVEECVVARNDEVSARLVLGRLTACRPDWVVGVGGGRVVDVGKIAAARGEVEFISVPTQAASDGICSPVAVMVGDDGRPQSLGARIPAGIIVDFDVLGSAPRVAWLSGLGDLVSNLSAVLDWRLANQTQGEEIDDFACLTAEAAASSVIQDDTDLTDIAYQQKLIRGLVLSGFAMEMAGSSRPASGSEHLISHALDRLLPQPRPHGLQVALGTLAAFLLRGDRSRDLVRFYRAVGLPTVPADIGISEGDFMTAVMECRATRPGRWTVLDRLSPERLERLREGFHDGDSIQ
ncbi:hypothetical protein BH20CHL6_BH20CHL6_04770 [soil metagenome]